LFDSSCSLVSGVPRFSLVFGRSWTEVGLKFGALGSALKRPVSSRRSGSVVAPQRFGSCKLTSAAITQIATEVAELHSFPVHVMASVSAGRSNYVEILLRIDRGRDQSALIELGVFRDAGIDTVRQHIADQIGRHFATTDMKEEGPCLRRHCHRQTRPAHSWVAEQPIATQQSALRSFMATSRGCAPGACSRTIVSATASR
jgi:hypothetical protein